MYGALDISVSGLIAQRTRLDVASANTANADATRDSAGNLSPFRRRVAFLAPGDPTARGEEGRALGVHVQSIGLDQSPFRKRWDPGHPDAQPAGSTDAGFVLSPNVDPTIEYLNAMEASRAYEANLAAAEATKTMIAQSLRLIA